MSKILVNYSIEPKLIAIHIQISNRHIGKSIRFKKNQRIIREVSCHCKAYEYT